MLNTFKLDGYSVIESAENAGAVTHRLMLNNPQRVCDMCGSHNAYIESNKRREYRDLEQFGKHCYLEIMCPRYKCNDCGKTFYPALKGIADNFRMTLRLRDKIRDECFMHPFTTIAAMHGIKDETIIRRVFKEYMHVMASEWKPVIPKALGIDEAHLAKKMRAVFVELDKDGDNRLIEMAENSKKSSVIKVLEKLQGNSTERYYPDVVTMDFSETYRSAVSEVFGADSKIIVDRFHVQQLVVKATSDAYSAIKRNMDAYLETLDPEDKRDIKRRWNSAKVSVRLFRMNKEDLSSSQQTRLSTAFKIYPQFATLYECKEFFRDIYKNNIERKAAEEDYQIWKDSLPDIAEYSKFHTVTKTIDRWHEEVFNYFDHGRYTNGPVEAINGIIKTANRIGRGYSYEVIRAKVLYRNNATEKPVFTKPKILDGVFDESGKPIMEFAMASYTPHVIHGSGVNLNKLLANLESAESLDDF